MAGFKLQSLLQQHATGCSGAPVHLRWWVFESSLRRHSSSVFMLSAFTIWLHLLCWPQPLESQLLGLGKPKGLVDSVVT
jgi:hypothetical protein